MAALWSTVTNSCSASWEKLPADEFLFSIMGEAAGKYGLLADLGALDDIMKNYDVTREALTDAKGNAEENAPRKYEWRSQQHHEPTSQLNARS